MTTTTEVKPKALPPTAARRAIGEIMAPLARLVEDQDDYERVDAAMSAAVTTVAWRSRELLLELEQGAKHVMDDEAQREIWDAEAFCLAMATMATLLTAHRREVLLDVRTSRQEVFNSFLAFGRMARTRWVDAPDAT